MIRIIEKIMIDVRKLATQPRVVAESDPLWLRLLATRLSGEPLRTTVSDAEHIAVSGVVVQYPKPETTKVPFCGLPACLGRGKLLVKKR